MAGDAAVLFGPQLAHEVIAPALRTRRLFSGRFAVRMLRLNINCNTSFAEPVLSGLAISPSVLTRPIRFDRATQDSAHLSVAEIRKLDCAVVIFAAIVEILIRM
jgi:hypothetical protein